MKCYLHTTIRPSGVRVEQKDKEIGIKWVDCDKDYVNKNVLVLLVNLRGIFAYAIGNTDRGIWNVFFVRL